MNLMVEPKNIAKAALARGKLRMSASEAFCETLVAIEPRPPFRNLIEATAVSSTSTAG